jgi:hypothetical protein
MHQLLACLVSTRRKTGIAVTVCVKRRLAHLIAPVSLSFCMYDGRIESPPAART